MDNGNDPTPKGERVEVEEETTQVRDDLRALRADLEALAEDVASLGRSGIRQVRDSARDMARAGENVVNEVDDNLSHTVRQRPIQSIAIAFLTGYVVSAIVR